MKKKTLIITLAGTAVLTAALCLLTKRFPAVFSSLLAVPFEQIADGLGALSRAGAVGNGAALALWAAVSAVPAAAALRCERGRETLAERITLFALSAMLLFSLYAMANPLLFTRDGAFLKITKSIFGVAVWSFILLFAVLRLIRLFRKGGREQLMRYLHAGLCVLGVLITAVAAVRLVNGVTGIVAAQVSGDPMAEISAEVFDAPPAIYDGCLDALRLAAELAVYIFDIVIILRLFDLLGIVSVGEQSEIVGCAEKVSGVCCTALGVSAALTVMLNVIQIAFLNKLSNVSVLASFPVIDTVFVIMALLFSRLIVENKRLRDDDSLFI